MVQLPTNIHLRRGIFLLLNVTAFAVLLFLVVWPILGFYSDRDLQIAEQHATLARLNAVIAQRPAVDRLISQAKTEESHIEFLEGANDGVAAANLQTLLKTAAQRAGANLRSVRTLAAEVDGGVKFMGAQIEIVGPIETIYRAVSAVEAGKPFLFIRKALLKPSQQNAARVAGTSAAPAIEASLEVLAPMKVETIK